MGEGHGAGALREVARRREVWALGPHPKPASSRLMPHSSSSKSSFRSSTKLMAMTTTEPAIPKKKRGTTMCATRRMTRSIVLRLYRQTGWALRLGW